MEHEIQLSRRYSIKPLVFPLTLMLGLGLVVGRWTAADAVAPDWAEPIHHAALLEASLIGGEDLVGPCQVTRVVDGEKLDLECNREQRLIRLLHLDGPEREERGYWGAPVEDMVTHAYPLEQYRDALRAAANHRKSGAVKVVLQP